MARSESLQGCGILHGWQSFSGTGMDPATILDHVTAPCLMVGKEPILYFGFSFCARLQREECCRCAVRGAAMWRRERSFVHQGDAGSAVGIGCSGSLSCPIVATGKTRAEARAQTAEPLICESALVRRHWSLTRSAHEL